MTASSQPVTGRAAWSLPVLRGLVVSEYRKTASTSAWWALLIPAALLCLLFGLITAKVGGLAFSPPSNLASTLSSFASKFAVIFGVVCTTSEFRHRTITTSYLSASGRPQLLAAKAILCAAVGAGYALVSAVAGLLGMLLGGGSFGDDLGDTIGVIAASLVVFALWGVLGAGLGALLGNQLAAIIGVLMYLLVVETAVDTFARLSDIGHVEDYLPGGAASDALTSLGSGALGELFGTTQLPWWISLLIFLAYTLVVYAAGTVVAQTRDIT